MGTTLRADKCRVVADDFFTAPGRTPSFRTPAWLIQLEDGGERKIYPYEKGLEFLRFHSVEGQSLYFAIPLIRAVSMPGSLLKLG